MSLSKNTSKKSNHKFFKQMTPESAYLMGLLEADGNISKNNKVITYSACEKDKELVLKTHALLETNVTIGLAQWKGFKKYRWAITSPEMITDLKELGFRSTELPKINTDLMPHWLRGLFDGDGSIFPDKQTKSYKTSFVFSTPELATAVQRYLEKQGIKVKTVYKKNNAECWYIALTSKQSYLLGKLIYKQNTICLERKLNRFKELEICRINLVPKVRLGKSGELLGVPEEDNQQPS